MTIEAKTGTGSVAHYGARVTDKKYGGTLTGRNGSNRATWVFDYDDLPVNGTNNMYAEIPANAYITEATIRVLTAMTGSVGTLTIGLEEADGTVIDVDGIDVAIAQGTLTLGTVIVCDGALADGTATIGANAGQLLVTTGGTVTAGRFEVTINYNTTAAGTYVAPTGT